MGVISALILWGLLVSEVVFTHRVCGTLGLGVILWDILVSGVIFMHRVCGTLGLGVILWDLLVRGLFLCTGSGEGLG